VRNLLMAMHNVQLVALAALLVLAPTVRAEVYKWVDEKGVVNYSNTPPEKRQHTILDEENGRVSTIESYDYSRDAAAVRERSLKERVDRLEQEAHRTRQTAAAHEAAAEEAYRRWREQCIAQRRVDCDDPYPAFHDPGYVVAPQVRPSMRPHLRPGPGMYRPTPAVAVGAGGVVGQYYRSPAGGILVGAGAYGIGAGYRHAPSRGVVVGPGPGGAGAQYYPVPDSGHPGLQR